jgi:tRNA A37 threonylcarbamoyltransferase TsaD
MGFDSGWAVSCLMARVHGKDEHPCLKTLQTNLLNLSKNQHPHQASNSQKRLAASLQDTVVMRVCQVTLQKDQQIY